MSDLMRYAKGGNVPMRDRKVAKEAKDVVDEVRLKALMADGAMALGGHIMEGILEYDGFRQSLSDGDPFTDLLLLDFEKTTVRQVKSIQASLYKDDWGI